MRNCFSFAILRGLLAILGQSLIFSSCIHASYPVHESKLESVRQTTQLILSISETERNFNNTLGVWNQLLTRLSYDCLTGDVKPDWDLYNVLTQTALSTLEDEESDSFQKHVASYFLTASEQNFSSDFLYFQGKAEEQKSGSKKFSLLNLSTKSLPDERTSDFIDEVLVASSDIIYLQEVFNFETAFRFFEGLKNNYAHFFILANQDAGKNTFIASKYPLEGIRFYPLNDEKNNAEGFFDFIVRNEQFSIGHVYAIQLAENLYLLQFEKILEKIQGDLLESSEAIPVFLCGNLCAQENPFVISLVQECFSAEGSKDYNAFLLKPLPRFFSNPSYQEYTLISCPVPFLNCVSGTLFSIQEPYAYSSYSIFRNDKEMDCMFEGNYTLLAAGGASVSTSHDSKGNTAVDVEFKTSTTTESGNTYSWSASGGVSRDERGDSSGKVETTFEINW